MLAVCLMIFRQILAVPSGSAESAPHAVTAARNEPRSFRRLGQKRAAGQLGRGARFTAEFAVGARAAICMPRTPRNGKRCAEALG
jgi:hypothetical protein